MEQFSHTSIIETFLHHVQFRRNQVAYIFLEDGTTEHSQITYRELFEKSLVVGQFLVENTTTSDRVLLMYETGMAFIAAFLGCLMVQRVAVPVHPPFTKQGNQRLKVILEDTGASLILSHAPVLSTLAKLKVLNQLSKVPLLSSFVPRGVEPLVFLNNYVVVDTTALSGQQLEPSAVSLPEPNQLSFLQYTSGSTSEPKGVQVTHKNLIQNEKLIAEGFENSSDSVYVSWLPFSHDMGLIGVVLQALFLGVPLTFYSPIQFIRNPLTWLKAITRYKATTSGAPNFAYELCIKKITSAEDKSALDLSSWTNAFNGAEPIFPETIDRFYDAFKDCGFKKSHFLCCYGLAEATLFVSGGPRRVDPKISHVLESPYRQGSGQLLAGNTNEDRLPLISSGKTYGDIDVKIVSPDSNSILSDGEVGEIVVSGESITPGYWKKPDANEALFVKISGQSYLRTGDLGFVSDEELSITGRIKDLIIIRGRNIYPQDIEKRASDSHPLCRVGCCAAFSITKGQKEVLVVVQEVKSKKASDLSKIESEIRKILTKEDGVTPYDIVLTPPKSILKTTSGKIQRRACKRSYLEATLDRYNQAQTKDLPNTVEKTQTNLDSHDKIRHRLDSLIRSMSEQVQRMPSESLHELGFDSIQIAEFSVLIEEAFSIEVPMPTLFGFDTKADLISWISEQLQASKTALPAEPNPWVDLHEETKHDESESCDDIAVIGFDIHLPEVESSSELWSLMASGKSTIGPIPENRLYDIDQTDKESIVGSVFSKDRAESFDYDFFGIGKEEARFMDPQQKFLIESVWKTIESAGYAMKQFSNEPIGVYVGASSFDFYDILSQFQIKSPYMLTGASHSFLSNRISYLYNFTGPSETIDTACSSGLVALHEAKRALNSNRASCAIVG
ncbi:MAG: acyl-CoA synthetase (AMP-forming)/AMP-acid ligase II/acyl carrier protein, partial [Candidatus Marinamargulisbacteria bacterium]